MKWTKVYNRIATYSIEDILPFIPDNPIYKKRVTKDNTVVHRLKKRELPLQIMINKKPKTIHVRVSTDRLILFKRDLFRCAECGLKGSFFAVERHRKSDTKRYHLNLYGVTKAGHEVLMTKDHVIPQSKGGPSSLNNYQILCCRCNLKKRDLMPNDANIKTIL